jgi:hypothetical protein
MVMMVVPSAANRSMRRSMVSTGTGFDVESYSLQYAQVRLQRRVGMMCAMTGWSVDTTPRQIILNSRARLEMALVRRRIWNQTDGICPVALFEHGVDRPA